MNRPDGRHEAENAGIVLTQCRYCRHRLDDGGCPAFPDGIPEAILLNRFDHRRPHHGDDIVTFEPRVDVPPSALARLYTMLDAAS